MGNNSNGVVDNVGSLVRETFYEPFNSVTDTVLGTVPQIIIAILLVVIGWFLSSLVRKFIEHIFRKFTVIDEALRAMNVDKVLEKCNLRLNVGLFIGVLFEIYIILIFALAALDVLGLNQVAAYLNNNILEYIPSVIVASIVIAVGALIAEFVGNVVAKTARATSLGSSGTAAVISKTAIWVTTLLVALKQLGVATQFINLIFTAIIISISIAIGLAFGLGGVKTAESYLEKLRREMGKK